MTAPVQTYVEDAIGVIRLNRPEAMNAFTGEMGHLWSEAYKGFEKDENVRVIVVTGAGKAFCAGADMSDGASTFDKQEDMSFSSVPVYPAYKLKKPVIAALNGHAVGVGFNLALHCDFRIVADEGKYGLLQVRRGVLADACSHWLLPRLIGMERALHLMLSGDKFSGQALLELGLALKSVPGERVFDEAMKMAKLLAEESSPLVMGMAKQLMWSSHSMSLDEMETRETAWLHHTMGLHDAVEGGMAYMEKRPANWQSSVMKDWPDEEEKN